MTRLVRFAVPAAAAAAAFAVALLAGCTTNSSGVTLADARPASASTVVGTAPMFAVSSAGVEAVAWVSAPDGGTDGRLYVSVAGARPVALRDSLGPVMAHGEAPPKIAFAPDGSLDALYAVGKVVPGARFPRSALRFARSADGGAHWSAPVTVTDDSTFGSHNFHALHVAGDGTIYVAWLDGRTGKSAAFVTRSTDGGVTWAPNVRVATGEACPCCRTAIATARDGTVYLAWRKVYPGSIRDIVVARSADHGATWSEPVRVHADDWKFDACPHAGPSLAVDSAGVVHVAWWTGKEGSAGVYYARSTDGAHTFAPPVALGVARWSRPAHVQLALAGHARVLVAWDDGTKRVPRVVLRASRDGGRTFGAAVPVSAQGRASTFPVLGVAGDSLAVAWSDESAAAADSAAKARPNMKEAHAQMGLEAVGDAQVLVRRGVLQ